MIIWVIWPNSKIKEVKKYYSDDVCIRLCKITDVRDKQLYDKLFNNYYHTTWDIRVYFDKIHKKAKTKIRF